MSFYPRSESVKNVYRRSNMPWWEFILQCAIAGDTIKKTTRGYDETRAKQYKARKK